MTAAELKQLFAPKNTFWDMWDNGFCLMDFNGNPLYRHWCSAMVGAKDEATLLQAEESGLGSDVVAKLDRPKRRKVPQKSFEEGRVNREDESQTFAEEGVSYGLVVEDMLCGVVIIEYFLRWADLLPYGWNISSCGHRAWGPGNLSTKDQEVTFGLEKYTILEAWALEYACRPRLNK